MRGFGRASAAMALTVGSFGVMEGGLPFGGEATVNAEYSTKLDPGEAWCVTTAGLPGQIAAINITPVNAEGGGYAALRSSDDPSNNSLPQPTSNVNFRVGSVQPNVAFVEIGSDGRACLDNSPHTRVDMVLDHLVTFDPSIAEKPSPTGAVRLGDTRGISSGAEQHQSTKLNPGESWCVPAQGEPGQFTAVNITPVNAEGSGYGALRSSDDPSNNSVAKPTSNVNFRVGSVQPNVAFVEIGTDNQVCFDNSPHVRVDVVLDQLVLFDPSIAEKPSPTGAVRLGDTRGISSGAEQHQSTKLNPGESWCVPAQGEPGQFTAVNITPVNAEGSGYGALRSSDDPSNNSVAKPTSNVNFRVGSVQPNVAFVEIGTDNQVCFDNSPHVRVDVVLDQLVLFDPSIAEKPSPTGAVRLGDTRLGIVDPPPDPIGPPSPPPGYRLCANGEPADLVDQWEDEYGILHLINFCIK